MIIIAAVLISITTPKELVINAGSDIEVYVGDEFEVKAYGDGMTEAEAQSIVWTTDNNKLVTIENGVLEASYDKNAFNTVNGDVSDDQECTYTTLINGTFERGLRTWEGSARVVVSLKPVDVKSGKLIKEPADSRNSYIIIEGSDNYSTYFYLESTSKSSNDLSFVIKKGDKATIYVPCDTYVIYEARGNTWYGSKILFGPQTSYCKDEGKYEFTSSNYWTFELDVADGNTGSDSLNSDDFPE